jgi:hypothetical protein
MWGLVLSCFAAVENYAGAIAIRFFLGVFEAAVTPGFALFTSQWYTKKEQGARTAIWFSFNGWAQVTYHFPLVHHRILTHCQLDLWRLSRLRHRSWLPQIRHNRRALENRLPSYRPAHRSGRHMLPLGHA